MEIFVARQPIFNRNREIFAYELLFRDGLRNAYPNVDGDLASYQTLSHSFLNIGLDQLTGGRQAFVNFTQDLLEAQIPTMFPSDRLVIEILETVRPVQNLVAACEKLVEQGYTVVLDDFVLREDYDDLIDLATIVKVDFLQQSLDEIKKIVSSLRRSNLIWLAEKVETYETFEHAIAMGFSFFQGYFFSKPEVIQSRDIVPTKMRLLEIVSEANNVEVDISRLEELIKSDVSLSYKLLRRINAAFFKRAEDITSIKQAIVALGIDQVRSFIALVVASELATDKPHELFKTCVIRGVFCEVLGDKARYRGDRSELFMLGLLSLIDAMLDKDMQAILKGLPLSTGLKTALLDRKGELALHLQMIEAYEKGAWEKCSHLAKTLNIDMDTVAAVYLEALEWADNTLSTG